MRFFAIGSKFYLRFIPNHRKTNTGLYFLWLGTNIGQSLEPIFMQFIARASESSVLQGYQLTFLFLPRDLKKLHLISQTYCVSDVGPFEWVFWSPQAKIKWADNTEALRILYRLIKKHLIIGSNYALRLFRTTKI